MANNKKFDAFMKNHKHWRYLKPTAKVVWPEEKRKRQKHFVKSAYLLAYPLAKNDDLPFTPDAEEIAAYDQ